MRVAIVAGRAACAAAVLVLACHAAPPPAPVHPAAPAGSASSEALGQAFVAAMEARDPAALRALAPSAAQLRGLCVGDAAPVVRAVDALLAIEPAVVASMDGVSLELERGDAPAAEPAWAHLDAGAPWQTRTEGWPAGACTLARAVDYAELPLHLRYHYGSFTAVDTVVAAALRVDGRVYLLPLRPVVPQVAHGAGQAAGAAKQLSRCWSFAKHLADLGALDEVPPQDEMNDLCSSTDNAGWDCVMAATTKDAANACATEHATPDQCEAAIARYEALAGKALPADARAKEGAACAKDLGTADTRCLIAAKGADEYTACLAPLLDAPAAH